MTLVWLRIKQLNIWETLCALYCMGYEVCNIFNTMKSFKKNLSGLLLYCNTFTSHMRLSKSYVHLCLCKNFHVSCILKPNMIFPLLPALRSQATLTTAREITLYFLSSFKSESFHFLHNTGHIRKDLWILVVRECFTLAQTPEVHIDFISAFFFT